MQISQSQLQKLSQELRLTPQQILQSTILQLTTLALESRINEELEQNPVLEETDQEQNNEREKEKTEDEKEKEELDWESILPSNDDYKPKIEFDRSKETIQYIQPAPTGLTEYLQDQLRLMNLDEIEVQIANQIIWNVDDKGYFTLPLDNIASLLNTSLETAEKVLKTLQGFEPTGIFARNLQECLLLQLYELGNSDDAILVIKDYFEDFANRRFSKIMKALNWEKERILEVQNQIVKLNPKPGAGVSTSESQYITPDLIVNKIDGEFVIEINDTRVPDLRINSNYLAMLSKGNKLNADTKTYLKKKVDLAKWFIQSIHQRRLTMTRVMKAIIERQIDFFNDNQAPLKPMILKDIAEDVKMDISTISRVTNGKYVQLSFGVYELKYFFNEGMLDASGEEVSTRIIKEKLREIVDSEKKGKPYSDEKLSKLLKEAGYPVARRTVAKYREQLKIPVARLRRDLV